VNLASLSLDMGFTELRVLVIRRGSKENVASELQYFDNFQVTDYCVVLFAGCGHIVGVVSSVFGPLIEVNMKRPASSIGDHLRSQNFCTRARKIRSHIKTLLDIMHQ